MENMEEKEVQNQIVSDQNSQERKNVDPDSGLTPSESVSILIQGVKIGQARGVYSFEDAEMISRAIRTFVKPVSQDKQQNQPS